MESIGSGRGAFWSTETLKEKLKNERLVDPYVSDNVKTAHYELTIGSEVYVSPDARSTDSSIRTVKPLEKQECFTIPPGQLAYLISAETVKIPCDALALISLKSAVKWKGLVNVSGFHVDPSYEGKLIFTVFNAGPAPVHLRSGDPCFLIWYAYLDKAITDVRKDAGFKHIDQSKIIPGEVPSIVGLHKRIQDLEAMQKYYLLVAGLFVGLAFLLLPHLVQWKP